MLQFDDEQLNVTRPPQGIKWIGWIKAFGTIIATAGNYYEWKLKVIETQQRTMTGVIENDQRNIDNPELWFYQTKYSITYRDTGNVAHGEKSHDTIALEEYGKNDIVGIHLDLIKNTIAFSKNDKKFDEITDFVKPNTDYVLVVSMYDDSGSQTVEIVDFQCIYG